MFWLFGFVLLIVFHEVGVFFLPFLLSFVDLVDPLLYACSLLLAIRINCNRRLIQGLLLVLQPF